MTLPHPSDVFEDIGSDREATLGAIRGGLCDPFEHIFDPWQGVDGQVSEASADLIVSYS